MLSVVHDVVICLATSSIRPFIDITVETGSSVVAFATLNLARAGIVAWVAFLVSFVSSVSPFVASGFDLLLNGGGSEVCKRFAITSSVTDALEKTTDIVVRTQIAIGTRVCV